MNVLFLIIIGLLIGYLIFNVFLIVVMIWCKKIMGFNKVTMVTAGKSDNRIQFWNMNRDEYISLLKNSDWNESIRLM